MQRDAVINIADLRRRLLEAQAARAEAELALAATTQRANAAEEALRNAASGIIAAFVRARRGVESRGTGGVVVATGGGIATGFVTQGRDDPIAAAAPDIVPPAPERALAPPPPPPPPVQLPPRGRFDYALCQPSPRATAGMACRADLQPLAQWYQAQGIFVRSDTGGWDRRTGNDIMRDINNAAPVHETARRWKARRWVFLIHANSASSARDAFRVWAILQRTAEFLPW